MIIHVEVARLRELADWLEHNETGIEALTCVYGLREPVMSIYCPTPEQFAAAVALIGDNVRVEYPETPSDEYVRVYRAGSPLIYASARADLVCEKVTVEMVERIDWKLRPIQVTDEQKVRGDALLMQEAHAVTG